MSAQRQHNLFTEQEYYYEEDLSATKHEFFRGEVFAMAGTTRRHNDVAGNIYISLRAQLRGKLCGAHISDQRIQVEANTLITYPDVVVVCPPFRFSPNNKITLLDATVIVEVLSDSTRIYDQGEKFNLARELPSLCHYILVEPNEVRVEHRFRTGDGDWETEVWTHLDDELELRAIECRLSVRDIYDEIEGL